MKINNILNRYADTAAAGRRSEAVASESIPSLEGFEPVIESGDAKSLALRKILDKYDVTDITPREFSEMLQELHKEGLISDDLYQQLGLIRGELDRAGIDADDSLDLVSFYEQRLAELQLDGVFERDRDEAGVDGSTAVDDAKQRLVWLRKMAAAQDAAELVGLNATA